MAWVKGHKGIKDKEEAHKLCREVSILGHGSEGVVTPAGLRAWSKRVRAEARGGGGGGILGWHRRAISAERATTEVAPQDTKRRHSGMPYCCQIEEKSGGHTVEKCPILTEVRKKVEKEEMEGWWTRHLGNRKKRRGMWGLRTRRSKREKKWRVFFCAVHELLTDFMSFDVTDFLCNLRPITCAFLVGIWLLSRLLLSRYFI